MALSGAARLFSGIAPTWFGWAVAGKQIESTWNDEIVLSTFVYVAAQYLAAIVLNPAQAMVEAALEHWVETEYKTRQERTKRLYWHILDEVVTVLFFAVAIYALAGGLLALLVGSVLPDFVSAVIGWGITFLPVTVGAVLWVSLTIARLRGWDLYDFTFGKESPTRLRRISLVAYLLTFSGVLIGRIFAPGVLP